MISCVQNQQLYINKVLAFMIYFNINLSKNMESYRIDINIEK